MCERKGLLAVEENFGCVAECGCGTLHVTVGPVSVAVDGQALRRLRELLGAAIDKLDSAEFLTHKILIGSLLTWLCEGSEDQALMCNTNCANDFRGTH